MNKTAYRVSFINKGQVYEVYATKVYQSDMYGFVVIEQLIFDHRKSLVVDPGEEKLKTEFAAVKRSFVPMHSVIRIDEVEKAGVAKVSDVGSTVAQFPSPIYTPKSNS